MAFGTMNSGLTKDLKLDMERQEFLRQARAQNVNLKAPGVYDASVKNFASSNDWAKREAHNRMGANLSVGQSEAATAEANANLAQSAADATNIVGDVFTLGAHRNLGEAGEALLDGKLGRFALESGKASLKIVGTTVLIAPGLAGKAFRSSGLVQRAVTHSKTLTELAQAGSTVAEIPKVSRLLHGAHNLVEAAAESRPLVTAYEVAHHGHQLYHAGHGAHASSNGGSHGHGSAPASNFATKGLAAMQSLSSSHEPHGAFLDSKF